MKNADHFITAIFHRNGQQRNGAIPHVLIKMAIELIRCRFRNFVGIVDAQARATGGHPAHDRLFHPSGIGSPHGEIDGGILGQFENELRFFRVAFVDQNSDAASQQASLRPSERMRFNNVARCFSADKAMPISASMVRFVIIPNRHSTPARCLFVL